MDLNNQDILTGAIAAVNGALEVEWVASGCIEGMGSVSYDWYRLLDPGTDQCAVVLWNAEEGGEPATSDVFEWTDKKDFTRRLLDTLKFGGEEPPAMGWFVILGAEGAAVNPDWVDAETLRAQMEKEAVELKTDFDFEAWEERIGFKKKPKKSQRGNRNKRR